jgi:PAS domain-containing protein
MADPGFWLAHVHPDDKSAATAAFVTLTKTATSTREYRFRHADGSWRWMHDEMRLVRDADGEPL